MEDLVRLPIDGIAVVDEELLRFFGSDEVPERNARAGGGPRSDVCYSCECRRSTVATMFHSPDRRPDSLGGIARSFCRKISGDGDASNQG